MRMLIDPPRICAVHMCSQRMYYAYHPTDLFIWFGHVDTESCLGYVNILRAQQAQVTRTVSCGDTEFESFDLSLADMFIRLEGWLGKMGGKPARSQSFSSTHSTHLGRQGDGHYVCVWTGLKTSYIMTNGMKFN